MLKKINDVLKRDSYLELIGVFVAGVVGIILWVKLHNLLLSILVSILLCIILVFIINRCCVYLLTVCVGELNKKYKYIDTKSILGLSPKIDEIINLDKKLIEFLDTYSSGKQTDLDEKELNKQWKKHSKEFIDEANRIFSSMSNKELLLSLLATEQICFVVDIFEYFSPFMIDVDYLLENSDRLIEAYYATICREIELSKLAINPYYLEKMKDINYFKQIEEFLISNMSNEQLMLLANRSRDWKEKIHLYGYLKEEESE